MACLEISLLGPSGATLDEQLVGGLVSNKARALPAYPAVESGRLYRRETLAGLVWPDDPERSARTNLSNVLSDLRAVLEDRDVDTPCLHVSRETILFDVQSDCKGDAITFQERVACRAYGEVADIYRGPFPDRFFHARQRGVRGRFRARCLSC